MAKKHSPIKPKELSERAEQLLRAHNMAQNSNINGGNKVDLGDPHGKVEIGTKCPVCTYRIRGLNHVDGAHHNKRIPSCSR